MKGNVSEVIGRVEVRAVATSGLSPDHFRVRAVAEAFTEDEIEKMTAAAPKYGIEILLPGR